MHIKSGEISVVEEAYDIAAGYLKATGHSLQMVIPKTANMPEMSML